MNSPKTRSLLALLAPLLLIIIIIIYADRWLRAALLYLSHAPWARRLMTGFPPAWAVASRFVAGETIADVIRVTEELNRQGMLAWRIRFRERLEHIAARYPPRLDVDLDSLADMATTLVEGGIILARVMKEPGILPRQILAYRDFIRLIFLPDR